MLGEAVGIVAFATNVAANLLLARKSEAGWVIRLVSNVFWLAFGLIEHSIANTLNSVTFACINVYGLAKWRRDRMQRRTTCEDHYNILCAYCHEIVRQCRCCPGSDKPTSHDGICGACQAMLPRAEMAS